MKFHFNDGGRIAAGYKGSAGDCVVRSVAIATGLPYQEIYDLVNELSAREHTGKRKRGTSNARTGVHKSAIKWLMESLGWQWTPTMQIGSGCTVHLRAHELPSGRLVVSVSKHLTAVGLMALFTIRTIARAVERDAFTGTGKRLGRELGSNQPNYLTIPISLAASSQTQIGSTPSSNFRQRLSQSIIGTKQLKVEATDSGTPFFIHTRNRAGCSLSLVQEVGLRITPLSGLCPS